MLEDDLIYLRKLEESDLDRTWEWINDPDIYNAIGVHVPVSKTSHKRWFTEQSFFKLLRDTGCSQVFIGAESADQKTLDYLNKRTNVNDYYKLINLAEKNKFDTRFSLIVGFPYESDKSVNKTLDFAKEIRDTKYCSVSGPKLFTPYPGTLEYNRAIERGFINPISTEDWSNIHRRTDRYIEKFPWLKENLTNKTLDRIEKEVRK